MTKIIFNKATMFFSAMVIVASNTEGHTQNNIELNRILHSVEMLCNNDLSYTKVIKFEGNAEVGGKIKILGAGVEGKVSSYQLQNLHNLYNNTRYDPVKCKNDMFDRISNIFFPKSSESFSTYVGPDGATSSTATDKGATACAASIANPKPCVAEYR